MHPQVLTNDKEIGVLMQRVIPAIFTARTSPTLPTFALSFSENAGSMPVCCRKWSMAPYICLCHGRDYSST